MAKLVATKKYASIKDGRVHSLFSGAELPEYNEKQMLVVEANDSVYLGDEYANNKLVPNSPLRETLETVKAQKAAELKIRKAEKILTGEFEFKGYKFQISQDTYNHVAAAAGFAALQGEVPADFFWISADNKKVPMSFEEFKQFSKLYINHSQRVIKEYEEFRAKLADAKTIDAIKSIKW